MKSLASASFLEAEGPDNQTVDLTPVSSVGWTAAQTGLGTGDHWDHVLSPDPRLRGWPDFSGLRRAMRRGLLFDGVGDVH